MTNMYSLLGTRLTILYDEYQTNSQYDLIEGSFPGGIETPMHLHTNYSETIYVLEGEFSIQTGTGTTVLKAGNVMHIPKFLPHAIRASGNTTNRALTFVTPSGLAKLVRQAGVPIYKQVDCELESDVELFQRLAQQFGDVILGPPPRDDVNSKYSNNNIQ